MANIGGPANIATVDLYTSNVDQGGPEIGQLVYGSYGRAFRYVKAGELLVVGNVLQGPAVGTAENDLAVAADTAVGATTLVLTNGTTVVTGGEYVGGTAEVSVTPGLGDEYTIVASSAAASGAALTLTLDRPLRDALTAAASKVTIRRSPYNGVIQAPTTLTGPIVGVAIYPIASGQFGWIQTKGMAAVLSDGTAITVANQQVCGGSGTAGCCTLQVAGLPTLGFAMRAAAAGKTIPVLLRVD